MAINVIELLVNTKCIFLFNYRSLASSRKAHLNFKSYSERIYGEKKSSSQMLCSDVRNLWHGGVIIAYDILLFVSCFPFSLLLSFPC